MKIGIIVAMGVEFRLVETLLNGKTDHEIRGCRYVTGRLGEKDIVLAQCGIGKVCAAVGTVEMIRHFFPDCILNTGVAGGIDVRLRVMDMVVGKEVAYHDVWCGTGNEMGQVQGMPARYEADGKLLSAALSVTSDIALWAGLICSGDQFITDRMALEGIKKNFPEGLAVDMESGAIAQVCHMYATPFLSCRIISDTPGQAENHALQYKDFWTAAPEKSFEILKQLVNRIAE